MVALSDPPHPRQAPAGEVLPCSFSNLAIRQHGIAPRAWPPRRRQRAWPGLSCSTNAAAASTASRCFQTSASASIRARSRRTTQSAIERPAGHPMGIALPWRSRCACGLISRRSGAPALLILRDMRPGQTDGDADNPPDLVGGASQCPLILHAAARAYFGILNPNPAGRRNRDHRSHRHRPAPRRGYRPGGPSCDRDRRQGPDSLWAAENGTGPRC